MIADPVVRNRGTIGGSLCQADPAEDLSAVCTAVKAKVVIRGADGERVVGMEDFHVGPYMTAVGSRARSSPRCGWRCAPAPAARTRRSSAAPATGRSPPRRRRSGWHGGTIADAGIALSAVGLTTIHLTRAEELLRGKAPSDELFEQAGADRLGGLLARAPTAAGRSTTSATSPASSPNAHCAARPRAPCARRPDDATSR